MPEHLIDRKPLTRGEELRVAIEPYRGRHYLQIRRWWLDGAELKPGKGASLDVRDLPWLRKALAAAEAAALQEGLLDEESFEGAGLPVPPELLT